MKVIFLVFLLLIACYSDYRYGRISNHVIMAGLAMGIVYQIWQHHSMGLIYYVIGMAVPFLFTYPLYRIGTFGAGDVKLLSVVAGFLHIKSCVIFLFLSFLIGAVFSLVKMIRYGNFKERMQYFLAYLWDISRKKQWHIYDAEEKGKEEKERSRIRFAGPVLFSILFYLGGFY